jgi:hypothetical protein
MEYPSSSNHNRNDAAFTANLGVTNGISSNTTSESEDRKPTIAQQLVRENVSTSSSSWRLATAKL